MSALRMGFSSVGSERSSSVKRRRGSLFKPFPQHEGVRHVAQLHTDGQPNRVMEGVLKQMGVDLRHHIGQQLRLAAP